MRSLVAAVLLALSFIFAPGSASAVKFTETIPANGELITFGYNLMSARPVRFIASGDFTNVYSSVISMVRRGQTGCFNDSPPPNCWYYSEVIYGQDYSFGDRGLDVVFDEDENEGCDPTIGDTYAYCEYRYIEYVHVDVENYGSKPVKFTVKLTVVPEPTAWALMIAGFGMAGVGLRRRHRPQASSV